MSHLNDGHGDCWERLKAFSQSEAEMREEYQKLLKASMIGGNLNHNMNCRCRLTPITASMIEGDHFAFVKGTKIPEGKTTSSSDLINHPPHYTQGGAKCVCGRTIECIDITRHLSFNLGNAVKYIWRCDLKGNSTEDLKKAVFYLNDEIQKRGGEK